MSLRFLQPDVANWFLAIPLGFLFWLLYFWAKRSFRRRLRMGPHLRGISRLSGASRDLATLAALVLASGMLVTAMMRPQLLLEMQVPEFEKHDLILMLDRSASMLAQDIKPTRLSRAIEEIRTFLRRKPDTIERVALVGFSGTSLVLSQLTSDMSGLFFYMDWMEADRQLYFGTDIGAALTNALEVTEKDKQKTKKIYVLLSDGEDTGGTLAGALRTLQQNRLRVHTIGIGGPAPTPIPVVEEGRSELLRDENNKVMTTLFSPVTLTNVARVTGGQYYRSETGTELAGAMTDIVATERKLVGWNASVEYRDVHRHALIVAALAISFLLLKL